MGWTFPYGATRPDVIQGRIEKQVWTRDGYQFELETLAYSIVGNVLWMVKSRRQVGSNEAFRYIECDLLAKRGNKWGYKDMEESMHPYYYSCPLSYLEMVPVANRAWRDQVQAHHARRNRKVEIGKTYRLVNCSRIPQVTITSLRPLLGQDANGKTWKIMKRLIGDEINESY